MSESIETDSPYIWSERKNETISNNSLLEMNEKSSLIIQVYMKSMDLISIESTISLFLIPDTVTVNLNFIRKEKAKSFSRAIYQVAI